jgi:hypothetical protein
MKLISSQRAIISHRSAAPKYAKAAWEKDALRRAIYPPWASKSKYSKRK